MMIHYILLTVFTLLQIADVWTTHYIINKGIGIEANPIMAFWIKKMGVLPGLLIPKVVMLSLVYLFIPQGQYGDLIVAMLILLYAWVIKNNINVIVEYK